MTNVDVDAEGNILALRVDITEITKKLMLQVEDWQQTAERVRKQWEESEWYLGEAKASCAHLDEQLRSLRGAHGLLEARHSEETARLQEAERQRNELNWSLGDLRAAHHELRQQTQLLTEQLAQAQDELAAKRRVTEELEELLRGERARRTVIETELIAVQTHGERRRALRKYRPDVTAELRTGDGSLLFLGLPRDVSRMGLGFASEQPIHCLADPLEIRLGFSGGLRFVYALGRIVWQRQEAKTAQYFTGCELLDVPSGDRETLEEVLAGPVQTASPPEA